jgi:translation initiation factor 2 subunit 1
VNIIGKIKLKFNKEDGIDLIKDILTKAKSVIDDKKDTRDIKISYIAAPMYRMEIISKNYLDAENILSDAIELIEDHAKQYNGEFEFIRE